MKIRERELGLKVIEGIELDCTCEGVDLHLLGYGIDVRDRRYKELEEGILEQKRRGAKRMVEALHDMGIWFDDRAVEGLSKYGITVAEMVAQAALREEKIGIAGVCPGKLSFLQGSG